MAIEFRLEEEKDHRVVETLIRDAFWDIYKPGCDEHLVVHNLRGRPVFVRELAILACEDGKIAGCIFYTKARVVDSGGKSSEVLCLGPVAVLPEFQKNGIGVKLINYSLDKAAQLGYIGVILFGNPAYYSRFGFENAKKFYITTSQGENFDPFMARELFPGSLADVSGKFYEDEGFFVSREDLDQFEKEFPYRVKHVTDTQLKI